jgi:hypothetical protein
MARSMCMGCAETFSSASSFDKHQRGVDPVVCLPPISVGLVERDGVWSPADRDPRFSEATKPAAVEKKTWTCATCGGMMGKTPGRGRPPKTCQNCGGKGIPV